ncbi:MAG: hypothetical protein QOI34_1127 [Verrucomicrobiota bacterium]
MKRTVFTLIYISTVSVAFAQPSSTPKPLVTPPPSSPRQTRDTVVTGSVTAFLPGQIITLKTQAANPISFALSKSVRFVDKADKEIKADRIKPGTRVQVSYEGNEDTRKATKVVIQD